METSLINSYGSRRKYTRSCIVLFFCGSLHCVVHNWCWSDAFLIRVEPVYSSRKVLRALREGSGLDRLGVKY